MPVMDTCLTPTQFAQAINRDLDFQTRFSAPGFYANDLVTALGQLGWTVAELGDDVNFSVRRLVKHRKTVTIAVSGDEVRVSLR